MKTTTKQSEPGTQAEGSIQLSDMERTLLSNFRQLNEEGQEKVFVYVSDLIASGRYTKKVTRLEWWARKHR